MKLFLPSSETDSESFCFISISIIFLFSRFWIRCPRPLSSSSVEEALRTEGTAPRFKKRLLVNPYEGFVKIYTLHFYTYIVTYYLPISYCKLFSKSSGLKCSIHMREVFGFILFFRQQKLIHCFNNFGSAGKLNKLILHGFFLLLLQQFFTAHHILVFNLHDLFLTLTPFYLSQ